MESLLEDLNPEQLSAVTHGNGPLLIVAGAGTGKTTVVTRRIAWLITSGACRPEQILALTFTEKAAAEMEERVDRLLPYGTVDLWISTFHAFCQRVLTNHALSIGLAPGFALYDQTASWLLIRKNFDRFQLEYYRPLGNPTKCIHALIAHFSRLKDEEIGVNEYLDYAEKLILNEGGAQGTVSEETMRIRELAGAYAVYEQLLHEQGALDFGGLLLHTLRLFRERPQICDKYRAQFTTILVDEFQDTNWAQYELVKLLSEKNRSLTVVGDDDQSIYKFRGASLANILEFKKDYPESREISLIQNYRSDQEILDSAYTFIQQNNPHRLEYAFLQQGVPLSKKLRSVSGMAGRVEHIHCKTLDDEVRWVAEKIGAIQEQNPQLQWSDFAVLVRANDSASPFIARFEEVGIPYQFMNLKGLYAKPAVLDLCAYLRLLINFHDSPALHRVLHMPSSDISPLTSVELTHFAYRSGISLWQALKKVDTIAEIAEDERSRVRSLCGMIEGHVSRTRMDKPAELFVRCLHDTGYIQKMKSEESLAAREAIDHIQQFYKKVKTFQAADPTAKLKDYLTHIALEQEAGEEGTLAFDVETGPDTVKIMTIHASKGLEFHTVFIVNMVDRRFPTIEREEAIEIPIALMKESFREGDVHLEEERRLFYVALTRAKHAVFLMSAQEYGGTRKKKISRFLSELGYEQPVIQESGNTAEMVPRKQPIETKDPLPYHLPSVFSFTQLAAFRKCPLQYKFAFLLKIPTFGKPQLSFGKSIHSTLQQYFESILARGVARQSDLFTSPAVGYTINEPSFPPREELLALFEKNWIDDWYPSQKIKDEYFSKGKALLEKFYTDLESSSPQPRYIERDFTIRIGEGAEACVLKGRIDRIDMGTEGFEILDYKTGVSKAGTTLATDDKEQLIIYQMAIEEGGGERVEKLTYYYLEDGAHVSFVATEKEKEKIRTSISETVKTLKGSTFEPTPGWHCRFCDFQAICEYKMT